MDRNELIKELIMAPTTFAELSAENPLAGFMDALSMNDSLLQGLDESEKMELVRMHAKTISIAFPNVQSDIDSLVIRAQRMIDIMKTIKYSVVMQR